MIRILIALMAACLAMPAPAAPSCHDAPRAAAIHHDGAREMRSHDDGTHRPDGQDGHRTAQAHVCFGCVPPQGQPHAIAAVPLDPEAPPVARLIPQLAGRSIAPATPPPRG